MRVSRQSWHYKLYRFWKNYWSNEGFVIPFRGVRYDYPPPKTLCSYFWTTVWLTLASIPGTLGLLLLVAVVYPPAVISDWVKARKSRRRAQRGLSPKEKQPNMAVAFFKARKQKVCPLIELVD